MVKERLKNAKQGATSVDPNNGEPSRAQKMSWDHFDLSIEVWDGEKHVVLSLEEVAKLQKTGEIETRVRAKLKDQLNPNDHERIEQALISTLSEVESPSDRQKIFNSVAVKLGIKAGVLTDGETAKPPVSLPAKAPEIYRERSNPTETAEQFLRRAYEPWLASGALFQFHIGKLDPSLLQGLKNQFKGRADDLRAVLPRKKDEVDQRLAAFVGREITDPAQRRLLSQAERNMSHVINKLKIG